jgi:hypothetical protein
MYLLHNQSRQVAFPDLLSHSYNGGFSIDLQGCWVSMKTKYVFGLRILCLHDNLVYATRMNLVKNVRKAINN